MERFVSSPLHSVLVISYEMLLRSLEQVPAPAPHSATPVSLLSLTAPARSGLQVRKADFGLIICDEGHRLKNSGIKTSWALSSLSCGRRVILTGARWCRPPRRAEALPELLTSPLWLLKALRSRTTCRSSTPS